MNKQEETSDLELKIVRLLDELRGIPPQDKKRAGHIGRIHELSIRYKEVAGDYINVEEARKRVYT